MSHDVHVLVNGNRCKQYHHDGKIFIEAKQGSEYSIEIKNNDWKRILAVCSVDGLDILNGKTAKQDGPGYVISGNNSARFDGFRVSDDKVAKFVFDFKGDSYAASKGDGSEKNVGVIGIRLFDEKIVLPTPPTEIHHHHWPRRRPQYPPYDPWDTGNPPWIYPSHPTIWCDTTYSTSCGDNTLGDVVKQSLTYDGGSGLGAGQAEYSANLNQPTKGHAKGRSASSPLRAMNCSVGATARGFDMGTKWGEAKESRVVEVEFERSGIVLNTNVYYASRQSLLEMGVPLGNEKQVSFPEPFADSKYAKPPSNWKG